MRAILLLTLLALAGCSLVGDDPITASAFATSVEVANIEGRTVTFQFVGEISDPCWHYADTIVHFDGSNVDVDVRVERDGGSVCPDVISSIERDVAVRVPVSGAYTFYFVSGPRAVRQVDVTVP